MTRTLLAVLISLLLLSWAQPAAAQVANENLAMKIVEARKKNAALMQQYSWNCRTELKKDGDVKDVRIDSVTFGPDGKPVRTTLNDDGSSLPRGFLRKRIAEKEKEETKKYLEGLRDVIDQYTLPSAGKVLDFISKAAITGVQGSDGAALLQMSGSGVVTPGDTLLIQVDPTTSQTRTIKITTTFEGDPVTVSATFKTTKAGLTFLDFAEVDVPAKNMVLQVHNYDYETNQ